MKTALKVIGIALAAIVSLTLFIVYLFGSLIFNTVEAIDDAANQEVIQKVEVSQGKVDIYVPIKIGYAVKHRNLQICRREHIKKMFEEIKVHGEGDDGVSQSCSAGLCEVEVSLKDPKKFPKSIDVYVLDDNKKCIKRNLTSNGHVQPSNYSIKIEMTDELLKIFNLSEDTQYELGSKLSKNKFEWQVMGTKKVKFEYRGPVKSDTLLLDNKEVANILIE